DFAGSICERATPTGNHRDVLLAVHLVCHRCSNDACLRRSGPQSCSVAGIVGVELAHRAALEHEVACRRHDTARPWFRILHTPHFLLCYGVPRSQMANRTRLGSGLSGGVLRQGSCKKVITYVEGVAAGFTIFLERE